MTTQDWEKHYNEAFEQTMQENKGKRRKKENEEIFFALVGSPIATISLVIMIILLLF